MKNSIKILGAYGAKSINTSMTCIQVDNDILIDAGNIIYALEEIANDVNHIFLTHSHLDHIVDIPFLLDLCFELRTTPLHIYGLQETIEHLQKYIFNWDIWPDFESIPLTTSTEHIIKFHIINLNEDININNTILKPIKTNHTSSSCGYVITKNNNSVLFTSDTFKCKNIWDEVNNNKNFKSIIIDVSFPSRLEQLATKSKHLTPTLLKGELQYLKRKDVRIFLNHLKPIFINEIKDEIETTLFDSLNGGQILEDGDILNLSTTKITKFLTKEELQKQYMSRLLEIGHSLTNEKNLDKLLEKILTSAKELSNADCGTLYLLSEDKKSLEFKVVQTDSLKIKMGGTTGNKITWPNVQLLKGDGSWNLEQVAALCAIKDKLKNIEDVYTVDGFNFEGTKQFDKSTGYRTKSMLVIPMKDYENNIIGVLQLLNKQDKNKNTIPFNKNDEDLIESMSSQAAVSIINARLIESLENLLMDFIKSIADAISEKSKYTAGHINRVAELATLIANSINNDKTGIYKDIEFNEDELEQIDIAAWMHDIGKITTPEYVVDKATKLETIYDRINTVIAKFEILKRDIEIKYLKEQINTTDKSKLQRIEDRYKEDIKEIENYLEIIKIANKGKEYTEDIVIEQLNKIATFSVLIENKKVNLLNDDELYNLSIRKGTLTDEERNIINNHVVVSYNMLKKLSFPQKFKRVPIIAGSHHKKILKLPNGKHAGYGASEIMDLDMSLEDKILAVADVFEALTASDRPYKEPNSLEKALEILTYMANDNELDKDLVNFFISNKLYEIYAKENLKDTVEVCS